MNYKRKLSDSKIAAIKILHISGVNNTKIAKHFGVATSTVQYHLDDKYKEDSKTRAKEYTEKYRKTKVGKTKSKKFSQSPAGQKSIAKSWIRNYLKNKKLTKEDVLEVLEEFEVQEVKLYDKKI